MAVPWQCGPQESLAGIQKFFLFWVPINPQKNLKAKLERVHFSRVQSGKISVCVTNVKKFKISIWINICSKFIDDGHGGVRQKLFQKEFGILINNKNPIYPGGLYKFAIYAYEVKHEAKFECGFISLNNGPLNCKLSINIKVFQQFMQM